MTNDRMALIEMVEKGADADLVRQMLAFAAERLMEAEVEARTGVPHGERDPDRLVQRNGYRERAWDTRAGRIDLEIPRLRKGSYPVLFSDIDLLGLGLRQARVSVAPFRNAFRPYLAGAVGWWDRSRWGIRPGCHGSAGHR